MSKRGQSKEKKPLRRVNPRAAGVDIGSATHWVAIDPSLSQQPVREFAAYTGDLQKLADWLLEHKIQTVAMESTGVYWIALFELLRERGLEVCLVDARATKQVAGRKSDISDCQWIQELHSYGLLKQAFVPEAQIATLRSYVRQRDRWVADAARAIQHMQQALELMNVKLTEVVSDITGTTGLAIIDSILAGERKAERLSELRDRRCLAAKRRLPVHCTAPGARNTCLRSPKRATTTATSANGLRPATSRSPPPWRPARAPRPRARSRLTAASATAVPILSASMPMVIAIRWPLSI